MLKAETGGWRRVALVIVAVGVFASVALIVGGEWARSTGFAGLVARLCTAGGFLLFGLSMAAFFAVFVDGLVRGRARDPRERAERRTMLLHEAGVIVLNVAVYGGTVVLALGALASLDRTGVDGIAFVLVIWAACIVAFVLYRRHRKRHRMTYDGVGPLALCAFFLGMACLGVFGGYSTGGEAVADLVGGPRTELCALSDVSESTPSGRYRALSQAVVHVDFEAVDGRTVRVDVVRADAHELAPIAEAGGIVRLTYYPCTHVFVSAEPVGGFDAGEDVSADSSDTASAR